MQITNPFLRARHALLLVAGTAVLTVLATLSILVATGRLTLPSRQVEVARRGAQVMPFDLNQTTHVFQRTENGGVQTVTANDPANNQQIALVQQHLQEEATKLKQGDFADPASIHGATMPGLAELRASAGRIDVRYTALPNGGQITYTTADATLLVALHDWFAAQLTDHGQHATDH